MQASIDLETLGRSPSAPILSVGLVLFNDTEVLSRHEWFPDIQEQLNAGAEPDASTVLWWFETADTARLPQVEATRTPVASVLAAIRATLPGGCLVWGNGPSFDCAILAELFRRHGQPTPWEFWNERCLRTLLSLKPGATRVRPATPHCALSDAEAQALTVINARSHKNV